MHQQSLMASLLLSIATVQSPAAWADAEHNPVTHEPRIRDTPANLGVTFLETNRVEVITGVNLPMVIKLAGLRQSSDLLAVARQMRDHGRNAIWVASDFLRGEKSSV